MSTAAAVAVAAVPQRIAVMFYTIPSALFAAIAASP